MDSNTDKQIMELLQIRLGLEQRSDKLFSKLLSQTESDPLDDIFKSLVSKNRQIQNLKKQLTEAHLQLQRYRKQNQKSQSSFVLSQRQQRHKSLPERHEEIKKNVEENKKALLDAKQQLKARTQSFIIFLLKCIRELSRNARPEDADRLVEGFEKTLKMQQAIIQDPQAHQQKKAPSERSTQVSSSGSQQNLQTILKNLNKSTDPQQLFTKISQSLGLQNIWQKYIDKLKKQSKSYQFLRDQILKPAQTQKIFGYKQPEFSQSITESLTSLDISILKIKRQVLNTEKTEMKNIINQAMEFKTTQLRSTPIEAFKIIKETVKYFYEKLDEMFMKHNQHPFQMVKRADFLVVQNNVKGLMMAGNWEEAKESLKQQIDQAFRLIQRKTKFYSANRLILRPH